MIQVRIPATTANLGPGFDCMGLALDLWNTFSLHLSGAPGSVRVETVGEGATTLPTDATHLVARTMIDETWPGMLPTDTGILIRCHNDVPAGSGMGSSSTAVLAGLIFASALAAHALHRGDAQKVLETVQSTENMQRVLERAIKLEGHGDNVAPALLGGLILVVPNGSAVVRRVEFSPLKVVVCVPDYKFLTVDARAALPTQYSKADAVFNIGHAVLVLEALRTGDNALLALGVADRIHEPYRIPLIPGATEVRNAALQAGAIACVLSGAGPGLLAFSADRHAEIGQAMQSAFAAHGMRARSWVLSAVERGTEIHPAPTM
ncbi:MAG: homoserine kinase [Chthonomonas sp.]|nr:homoserine kinase [Chthonomonas sp.]